MVRQVTGKLQGILVAAVLCRTYRVRAKSSQCLSNRSKKPTRMFTSLMTPENSYRSVSHNTTKATRASKSRSRVNDSDLMLIDDEDDASPRSSRSRSGPTRRKNISTAAESLSSDDTSDGCVTPENESSPRDAETPVLNIRSLVVQSLDRSKRVRNSRARKSNVRSAKRPNVARSKSCTETRSSRRAYSSKGEDGIITPTSDVKLAPEAVKNKHSTAKKRQSKRSLIDDLDESDVVEQLFSSPVKRNLSRSMNDFDMRDDETPLTDRSFDTSVLSDLDDTVANASEVFASPDPSGVKRLSTRGAGSDLSDVGGVKTPRARRSIANDLTRVSGVKRTFARSPRNRLSDVRVKELFLPLPRNDLRRVSKVKYLFRSVETRQMDSPTVRNMRGLFGRSPRNDLLNVSGVRGLKRRSPRNDLADVEGIDQLFEEPAAGDVSGVELLEEQDADSTFDLLSGKPKLKAYGKSKSMTTFGTARQRRAAKSLHDSIDAITTDVEGWLQDQIQGGSTRGNAGNASRELKKLCTATVEGAAPVLASRSRSSAFAKYQSTLPIKKRSIASLSQHSNAEGSRVSLGRSEAEISVSRTIDETRQSNISKRAVRCVALRRSKAVAEKSRNSRTAASSSKGQIAEASQRA